MASSKDTGSGSRELLGALEEGKGEEVGRREVVGEGRGEVESVADMSRLGSEPSELLTETMVGRGLLEAGVAWWEGSLPALAVPEVWDR